MQATTPSVFLTPEQKLKQNNISQANVGSGSVSSGILRNETVSIKALDKVICIFPKLFQMMNQRLSINPSEFMANWL